MDLSFKNRYHFCTSGLFNHSFSERVHACSFSFHPPFLCRGYFSGENNSVEGKIKRGRLVPNIETSEVSCQLTISSLVASDTLYKIQGRWDRVVTCTGTIKIQAAFVYGSDQHVYLLMYVLGFLADKKTKQEEVLFDIEEKRRYFTPPTGFFFGLVPGLLTRFKC